MTFRHLSSAHGLLAAVRFDSESKMDVAEVLLYSDSFPGRKINSAEMFVLVQAFCRAGTFLKHCWHCFEGVFMDHLMSGKELGAEKMDQVISDEDATLEYFWIDRQSTSHC